MSSASHVPFFKSEFQLNFVRLSIPLRATAFKFATSNSFRFRYVRQISSLLRTTTFDSVTCDSFQVGYAQQLSIPLRATAFKFARSNSFQVIFSMYEPLPNYYFCFDKRSVVLPPREFVRSLYTSRSLTMHIQFILLMTLKFS